jgi:hypothetical protein
VLTNLDPASALAIGLLIFSLLLVMIGVALGNAFVRERSLVEGVHWSQVWSVLEALALSPGRQVGRSLMAVLTTLTRPASASASV